MTIDNTVAVAGTVIVTLAFLVLGTEMLGPNQVVPEEERIAPVLGRLLGDVWGPVGFWFMVLGVFVGFWDTVLSDQDGFGRMFSDGTRSLARTFAPRLALPGERALRRWFVGILLTVAPVILYLVAGRPVTLLKIAGAIEAAHIPIVAGLTLYANHRTLPRDLRPSTPTFVATVLAALFFAAFAVFYLVRLV
jgi:hypothetical protein